MKASANPAENSEERRKLKEQADSLGLQMYRIESENRHILQP